MNVLILTPDSVGSTLLQRVLTVHMILSDFDKPVINLHELTNGLASFYSPQVQGMIVGKDFNKGYSQSLEEITTLLKNHDHYKTSRLAHYHLIQRADSNVEQKNFFRYLNDNFFVISAKRNNLLDYALSWCIRSIFKDGNGNVYSSTEKVFAFLDMYKDPVNICSDSIILHLERYKNYLEWSKTNFDIASHFYYDVHMPNLENYILNLPIFTGKERKQWSEAFDISFQDFNKCHKSVSDLGAIALSNPNKTKLLTVDSNITNKNLENYIVDNLPTELQTFVENKKEKYVKAKNSIQHLVKLGFLPSQIPIKKHTFAEKRMVIKNFDECVYVYNDWILKNPELGEPFNDSKLQLSYQKDDSMWSTKE